MNKRFGNIIFKTLFAALLLMSSAAMAQRNEDPGQGQLQQDHRVIVGGDIFGGGNEANVKGSCSVSITQPGSRVNGSVYGGGALADVNVTERVDNNTTTYEHTPNTTTTVDIIEGTIIGNVYGGGLGDSIAYGGTQDIAAKVYGPVTVNIGELVGGVDENGFAVGTNGNVSFGPTSSVYGCNNLNGTPLDNVVVNIYQTAHTQANSVPGTEHAIYQVFGGGNKADYVPASNDKKPTVHIWTCENTIQWLYGGGNAANLGRQATSGTTGIISASDVIIDGGRIEWVFGGGNGYSATDNHTEPDQPNYNPGADIYGDENGNAVNVTFHAGYITYFFGGSNEWGDIIGKKNISILSDGTCSNITENHIVELYGGNNKAPIENNVGINFTMPCPDNPCLVDYLFGGSRMANISGDVELTIEGGLYNYVFGGNNLSGVIDGNVTLNLYGGTIQNAAFGGNKGGVFEGTFYDGGTITGDITVNVEDQCDCPLEVKDVFGAGDLAVYTAPSGDGAREFNPMVNVNNLCTVEGTPHAITGNVYGGGNGDPTDGTQTKGSVSGNPKVTIGDLAEGHESYRAAISGNVFGGGNAAKVNGNTTVLMQKTNSTVGHDIYGGGNLANVSGSTVVNVTGGTVTQDVYGGGALADVNVTAGALTTGATTTVTVTGGTVRDVYGGGLGSNEQDNEVEAKVYGPVTVTVDAGTIHDVFGCNNQNGAPQSTVEVFVNNNVTNNVYGGGNLAACSVSPKVYINNGTVTNVFGGGKGDPSDTTEGTAQVNGNPEVVIGDVTDASYCAVVTGNVYGGGDAAKVNGNTKVTYNDDNSASTVANVFGGGNKAGVTGTADVDMILGTVTAGLYGGCNDKGTVVGNITVDVTGGTIGATGEGNSANVHGGGYGNNTSTAGHVDVAINGTSVIIYGDVYGGSALGNVNDAATDETNVILTSGTIHGDLYGGGLGDANHAAAVNGKVQVTVNGGTVTGAVYGCNNVNGAPQSTVNVDIYNTDQPESGYALGAVFGGGNRAAYNGKPVVKVHNCDNKIEYIYGGGNAANVLATDVTIYGGNTIGNVFGGCYGANVTGEAGTDVKIYGGTILKVFGGNNHSGTIAGTLNVTVDKQGDSDENGTSTACDMHITEVYGGGNLAASHAGSIAVNCTGGEGEGIEYLYGGANDADVTGPIVLDIIDGRIQNVFGGNNTGHAVSGGITVNINEEASPCGWYIGNVFGGGNHATYAGTPDVNVINGTVSLNVYGGGNEAGVGGGDVSMTGGTVLGNIYGGCNTSGVVNGNIAVEVKGGTIGSQTNLNNEITSNVFGGGYGEATSTTGDVTVTVTRASGDDAPAAPTIYGDVYGGSALGTVNDDGNDKTTVHILDGILVTKVGTENGFPSYTGGNVYGGGLGEAGAANVAKGQVNGQVFVNIGSGVMDTNDPRFTSSTSGNATIQGNIYGCNNTNGSPQQNVVVNVYQTAHTSGVDEVDDEGYALANVFGGGNKANFRVDGKTLTVNIYGCENTIRRTFGGSNAAASNSVFTMIQGGRIHEAYGGGNGEVVAADIYGDVNLAIHGGNVIQSFGGSNQHGTISGSSVVTIDGEGCGDAEIEEFFCGGNFADFYGDIDATIRCADGLHIKNLYGGCKQADVLPSGTKVGNVHLVVEGGIFENIYGGSQGRRAGTSEQYPNEESADISGSILLEIHGGTVTNAIYGGSHILGKVAGTITVNVEDKNPNDECALDLSIADVYGGGNEADYDTAPTESYNYAHPDYPQINIKNATVKNVYGGGYKAKVTGNPQIHLKNKAKLLGNVYGGGNMGVVDGHPNLVIDGKDTSENPHTFPTHD